LLDRNRPLGLREGMIKEWGSYLFPQDKTRKTKNPLTQGFKR